MLHHTGENNQRTGFATEELNLGLTTNVTGSEIAIGKEQLVNTSHGLKQDFGQIASDGIIQSLEFLGDNADISNVPFVWNNV